MVPRPVTTFTIHCSASLLTCHSTPIQKPIMNITINNSPTIRANITSPIALTAFQTAALGQLVATARTLVHPRHPTHIQRSSCLSSTPFNQHPWHLKSHPLLGSAIFIPQHRHSLITYLPCIKWTFIIPFFPTFRTSVTMPLEIIITTALCLNKVFHILIFITERATVTLKPSRYLHVLISHASWTPVILTQPCE